MRLILDTVTKNYGARRVLRGVSFTASAGEVVVVRGANGSGKSTLLRIVAGLLRPTKGRVTLKVGECEYVESPERRAFVAYAAPDIAFYPELSARENLLFLETVRGHAVTSADCDRELYAVGLKGRERDAVSGFSSGMKQRLRLAWTRLGNAPLLLLDEPSLALDAQGVTLVAERIALQKERGGITLLATNDDREAALGERTIALGA